MNNNLTFGEFAINALAVGCVAAIAHPVGFLGGAVFGGIGYIIGKPVCNVCIKALDADKPHSSSFSKIAAAVAGLFVGSAVSAWAVKVAFGLDISFKAAVLLNVAGGFAAIGIVIGVVALFGAGALAIISANAKSSSW